MSEKAICIRNLSGGYTEQQVLKDLTITVEQGGFTAIAGPNGAGKSTVLKYLIRQLKTESDRVCLFGKDINSLSQKEIAHMISFQGQYSERKDDFTVREIVALGRYSHGNGIASSQSVDKALETAGITHLADKFITRISGGEFQLAMLARTICQDAPVMALDEPANNLDPLHQSRLMKMLQSLSRSGKTVLCVLHDLNAILRYCDNCILMKDGKVFSYGETKSVLTEANIKEVYKVGARILESDGKPFLLLD